MKKKISLNDDVKVIITTENKCYKIKRHKLIDLSSKKEIKIVVNAMPNTKKQKKLYVTKCISNFDETNNYVFDTYFAK